MRTVNRVAFFTGLCITTTSLAKGGEVVDPVVNPFMISPFILLLLAIAFMPLVQRHWWDRYYPVVCTVLGLTTLVYYLFILKDTVRVFHMAGEYMSFIVLLGSLFVVAGGIHIRIRGKSKPLTNVILLSIGALASNLLGTTGASMILIRPYLRVNKYRLRGFHVVFFIILVSNMGGALTPIGDPPLFLGYLRGVPIMWALENLWSIWAFAVVLVLLIFFAMDWKSFRKYEAARTPGSMEDFHEDAELSGWHNLFFLAVVLMALFMQPYLREALMVAAAAGSYYLTKPEIRRKNDFTFVPIKEVAILFLGIFATMIPALDWLELNAARIGITTPGGFFWGTGVLSSILDNAPTYLSFFSASIGLFVDQDIVRQVQQLLAARGAEAGAISGIHAEEVRNTFAVLMRYHGDLVSSGGNISIDQIRVACLIAHHNLHLMAISIAAVFFGACTYVGNGPNFMVKSIAEKMGVPMPTFLGYVGKYALPILLPVFAVLWFFFFRG